MAGSRRWFFAGVLLVSGCSGAGRLFNRHPAPERVQPAGDEVRISTVEQAQQVSVVPERESPPTVMEPPMPVPDAPAPTRTPDERRLVEAAERQALNAPTTPPPPAWDIEVAPYESHERVSYFIGRFSGTMKPTFEMALARQARYAPMIKEKLRGAGLPEDMSFLPIVESWYDRDAYSRAAAVGMWQFMTGTARGVGLRVDWWVDERRDPVRSTDGAVRYLTELRETFGSVYLAAAAYNGGSGRISRGLERHSAALEGTEGEALFFALAEQRNALRTETSDYVPKLIAAALVGKDPVRYELHVPEVLEFTWDSVTVPPATPLAAVAKALDVPLDSVLDYNPHVLRGMTPPTGPAIWLRVPSGSAAGFLERFAAIPEAERTGVKRVVTKDGDYMTRIANANKLTAKQLNWYNPQATRLRNGNLHPGQRILVPRLDVVRAARDIPDPKIERYGSSATAVYAVRKGDTLGGIARKNGTTVAAIKRLNSLRSDNIRIGQRLRVR